MRVFGVVVLASVFTYTLQAKLRSWAGFVHLLETRLAGGDMARILAGCTLAIELFIGLGLWTAVAAEQGLVARGSYLLSVYLSAVIFLVLATWFLFFRLLGSGPLRDCGCFGARAESESVADWDIRQLLRPAWWTARNTSMLFIAGALIDVRFAVLLLLMTWLGVSVRLIWSAYAERSRIVAPSFGDVWSRVWIEGEGRSYGRQR